MKLSAKSRYGARILADLATFYNKGPVQVSDISKRQNISVKYVEQLIRPLKKGQLIMSARGPKGGHVLAKAPEKITLGEVIKLFEFQNRSSECFCSIENCVSQDTCQLRLTWQEALNAFYATLDVTTIADLEDECCG